MRRRSVVCRVNASEAVDFGKNDLEIFATHACDLLHHGSDNSVGRWIPAFQRLHYMLGFHNSSYSVGGQNSRSTWFAMYAAWLYYWSGSWLFRVDIPVCEAWAEANEIVEGSNVQWAYLRADAPGVPTYNERLRAAETTDPVSNRSFWVAEVLDIDVKGNAQVPHGYAVGSDRGQVEVFSASGAVRARNVERLTAYADEGRTWSQVERDRDGTYRLADSAAKELSHHGLELLRKIGVREEYASVDVSLGQWAKFDDKETELDSGPGRATVRFAYAVHGLPLIGPGAKTNLHFDPEDDGRGVSLARLFHVNRGIDHRRGGNPVPRRGVLRGHWPRRATAAANSSRAPSCEAERRASNRPGRSGTLQRRHPASVGGCLSPQPCSPCPDSGSARSRGAPR